MDDFARMEEIIKILEHEGETPVVTHFSRRPYTEMFPACIWTRIDSNGRKMFSAKVRDASVEFSIASKSKVIVKGVFPYVSAEKTPSSVSILRHAFYAYYRDDYEQASLSMFRLKKVGG